MRKLVIAEFCSNLRHIARGVEAAKWWTTTTGDDSEALDSFRKVASGMITLWRLEQSQLDYTLFFRIPENEWIVLASHKIQQLVETTPTSEEFIQELESDFFSASVKLNWRFWSRHIAYLHAPASAGCKIKPTPTAKMLMDWRKVVKNMRTQSSGIDRVSPSPSATAGGRGRSEVPRLCYSPEYCGTDWSRTKLTTAPLRTPISGGGIQVALERQVLCRGLGAVEQHGQLYGDNAAFYTGPERELAFRIADEEWRHICRGE